MTWQDRAVIIAAMLFSSLVSGLVLTGIIRWLDSVLLK